MRLSLSNKKAKETIPSFFTDNNTSSLDITASSSSSKFVGKYQQQVKMEIKSIRKNIINAYCTWLLSFFDDWKFRGKGFVG